VQQSISCTFSGAIWPDIIIIYVDLFKADMIWYDGLY